uniref:Peptidase S1 domain-containing protein n=1 Tax=Romanomermis culicivorax TaxID=13658 RepID=A0A915J2J1_ROMCU
VPSFNYRSLQWDLALLEIDPINFTTTIRSIKIATAKPPTGETVTLAGWGFLNRSKPAHALHKIELQVIDDCDYYPFSTGRFCARHPNSENELKDACIGDSGSPLMIKQKENDQWSLTGVMTAGYTSVVEDCEKLGGYSLYADLSHPPIKSWLSKAVGEDIFHNGDEKEDGKHRE